MYHFTQHALPYIYLENGYESTSDGTKVKHIDSYHGINRKVAETLCTTGKPLTGPEITYLVSMSDIEENDFAGMLGMTPEEFTAIKQSPEAYTGREDTLLRLLLNDGIFHPGQSFNAAGFVRALSKKRENHNAGPNISRMQLKLDKTWWNIESITYK